MRVVSRVLCPSVELLHYLSENAQFLPTIDEEEDLAQTPEQSARVPNPCDDCKWIDQIAQLCAAILIENSVCKLRKLSLQFSVDGILVKSDHSLELVPFPFEMRAPITCYLMQPTNPYGMKNRDEYVALFTRECATTVLARIRDTWKMFPTIDAHQETLWHFEWEKGIEGFKVIKTQ